MFRKRLFLSVFAMIALCGGVRVYATGQQPCNCRSGYYCGSEQNCLPCPAGMYCTNGESHLCGPGYYQNQQGQSSCVPCPEGQYPFSNHVSCDLCSNSNLVVMEYNDEMVCGACSAPTPYANEDHSQCVTCYGEHEFIIDDKWCRVCPDNAPFMNEEYTDCVACDTGNYFHDANGVCKSCDDPAKPYANEEHGECVACDKDAYIIGTDGVCKHCSDEAPYANIQHTQCTACNDGNPLNGVCYPNCSKGLYLNSNGICTKCPSGYYVNNEKKCVICESGNYCGGDGNMNPCPDDTFSAPGQRECSKCPDGYTKISRNATYIAGESLDNLCKKLK